MLQARRQFLCRTNCVQVLFLPKQKPYEEESNPVFKFTQCGWHQRWCLLYTLWTSFRVFVVNVSFELDG